MLGAVLQCSATCGTGTRKRTVTCTNSQGKCDASTRPRAEEACEDHSGCYEWKTGDWSKVRPARLCGHPAGGGASGRERAPAPRASVTAVTPEWPLAFQTPCLPVTPHGVRFQGNRRAPRAQGGVLRALGGWPCCHHRGPVTAREPWPRHTPRGARTFVVSGMLG